MDEYLTFGQYDGESVYKVAKHDRKYLYWLLDQDWFEERFPDTAAAAEKAIKASFNKPKKLRVEMKR